MKITVTWKDSEGEDKSQSFDSSRDAQNLILSLQSLGIDCTVERQ